MDNWQQENNINNEESHDTNVAVEEGQETQNENLNDDLDALLADDSNENAVSRDGDNDDADKKSEDDSDAEKSEQEQEEELRAAIEEEELDNATDSIAESVEEDEEFLETNNWDWIADLIRFVVKIKQSDDEHVKTVSSLFYESAKQLKPLALAEAIDLSLAEGQDERTQMIEFMLRLLIWLQFVHPLWNSHNGHTMCQTRIKSTFHKQLLLLSSTFRRRLKR